MCNTLGCQLLVGGPQMNLVYLLWRYCILLLLDYDWQKFSAGLPKVWPSVTFHMGTQLWFHVVYMAGQNLDYTSVPKRGRFLSYIIY